MTSRGSCARRSLWVEGLEGRLLLAAGDLDAAFGAGGTTKVSFGANQAVVDVALDSSGAAYVLANTDNLATLVKYSKAGVRDTTFGGGKTFVMAPNNLAMSASSLVVQGNGRILVAGTSGTSTNAQQVVLRYLSNGSLDTSWSGDGIAAFGPKGRVLTDIALQKDGKVVTGALDGVGFEFFRLNTDGSLDGTFAGGSGQAVNFSGYTTAPTAPFPSLLSIAIGEDDRIAAAGELFSPSPSAYPFNWIGVMQMSPDGQLDNSFDTDGKLVEKTDTRGEAVVEGITIAPDQKILISGSNGPDGLVIRYNTNGSRDTGFGTSGMANVTAPDGSKATQLRGVRVLENGDIAVAGRFFSNNPLATGAAWAMAVLDTTGKLNPAFSSDGVGSYIPGIVKGMVVQPDGKFLLAGTTQSSNGIAVGRVLGFPALYTVANAIESTTLSEGSYRILTATAVAPPGRTISACEWDFDYDGLNFNVDTSGASVTFWAGSLDGPGSRTVALRARDNNGAVSPVNTLVLSIRDRAPTAIFTNSGPVFTGQPATVTFSSPYDPSAADVAAGFKYSFDFNQDGIFEIIDSTSPSHAVPATIVAGTGNKGISGRISNKDGSTDYSTILKVNALIPNPPSANAGGPYSMDEGTGVSLNALGSAASGRFITAYEWDFNYDGRSFEVEGTGATARFSGAGTDGPATRTIALRVRDTAGDVSAISTATVTIRNAPPIAFITAPKNAAWNDPPTVTVSQINEMSQADNTAGFRISYDWNDDGTWEVVNSSSRSATAPASFMTTPGTKYVRARVTDKDGASGDGRAEIMVGPRPGADRTPPTATLLTALRLRQTGGSFYKFTVRYTDASGIDGNSITSSDIYVTGPNGFNSQVRLLSKTQVNSTSWDGFYRLAAPGGTWDSADNGLYTINMNGAEVLDRAANAVVPGPTTMPRTKNGIAVPGQTVPGQFSVKILAPLLVRPSGFMAMPWEDDRSLLA